MPNRTLHIESISVNRTTQPGAVRGGVLITDPPKSPPWRLYLATTRPTEWELGDEHDLEVVTREGHTVRGRALLAQTDGQSHMFHGLAELDVKGSPGDDDKPA